jgi:hypothetical protein
MFEHNKDAIFDLFEAINTNLKSSSIFQQAQDLISQDRFEEIRSIVNTACNTRTFQLEKTANLQILDL